MFTKIDHIGIAVIDLASEIARYQKDYGVLLELKETLSSNLVELAFLKLPTTTVELIAPLPRNVSLKKFLDKNGSGLHHIAYEVADIIKSLADLKSKNYRLIDEQPRAGARGSIIAFIHPSSCNGVLTELVQYI